MTTPFDPPSRLFSALTRRCGSTLVGLLGMLLVVDLVLKAALPDPPVPILPETANDIRRTLARVAKEPDGWLLLGDSVLAGDVMRGRVDKWQQHRVLDYMRSESSPTRKAPSQVTFEQVALDGMLPVDMLRIVRELDVADPQGEVGIILELNPRYFSKHYATQRECTREILCELGPRITDVESSLLITAQAAGRMLADHVPIVRHKHALRRVSLGQWTGQALEGQGTDTTTSNPAATKPRELEGQARLLEHYRKPIANRGSIQYRAMLAILKRLHAKGRRAVLFATPLADGFAGELDAGAYAHYISALDLMVTRAEQPQVRFYSLDHPLFLDGNFIDHAHLWPEGNRQLALNILHLAGIELGHVPDRLEVAYPEGPDESLVASVALGFSEGAPWQALLNKPTGIDVSADGRIVIADTNNHCIRELAAGGSTLRVLAGQPRFSGDANGTLSKARFDHPVSPVIVGERVFVLDRPRDRVLREIVGNEVFAYRIPEWGDADQLRSDGRLLYVRDKAHRILSYDPETKVSKLLIEAEPGVRLKAFDVSPDGRIFVADGEGAIWESDGHTYGQIGANAKGVTLRFANTGESPNPQAKGDVFPFAYDRMSLHPVTGIEYVARYDGVLVQTEAPSKGGAVTERVHLRFISFGDQRIYPWLKALTHGGAYIYFNKPADVLSSNVHLGSMAIHQDSATLFYVERHRSRVLKLSDGLLGVTKLGNHVTSSRFGGFKDLFGIDAGRVTTQTHHPELYAHRRLERTPRKGPYFALLLGSSMTAVSDAVGQYSMGRVMEEELRRELGMRDGIRFDLVQRSYRGPRFATLVQAFGTFVRTELAPDVVFFEIHSGRMYKSLADEKAMLKMLATVQRIARQYDTLVVFLDNDAMSAHKHDGLRVASRKQRRFFELAAEAGVEVVHPGDMLLREHLRLAPWGTPPLEGPHGTVWAIDTTAQAFAKIAYPAIRAHLQGRVPAVARLSSVEEAPLVPLSKAFAAVELDWAELAGEAQLEAVTRHIEGQRMSLFIDLGKTGHETTPSGREIQELVVAFLAKTVGTDPMGQLVAEVEVVVARFDNYDEYGVGLLEAAKPLAQGRYDAESLEALLRGYASMGE